MNILHWLGKRFSNGAKINTMNYLDLCRGGFATKKDKKLLEKTRRANLQRSINKRCKERDRYSQ